LAIYANRAVLSTITVQNWVSTQFVTINPGTLSNALSASLARSSRFGSLTCGASRKIGAVTFPGPVFERDTTA